MSDGDDSIAAHVDLARSDDLLQALFPLSLLGYG